MERQRSPQKKTPYGVFFDYAESKVREENPLRSSKMMTYSLTFLPTDSIVVIVKNRR